MPLLLWFQTGVESVLVPAYTLAVVLYLSATAYSKYCEPLLWQRRKLSAASMVPAAAIPAVQLHVPTLLEEDDEPQPVDLTGAYKLISNDGFERILEVQGVPWPLRR
jgi:hypothetical protein